MRIEESTTGEFDLVEAAYLGGEGDDQTLRADWGLLGGRAAFGGGLVMIQKWQRAIGSCTAPAFGATYTDLFDPRLFQSPAAMAYLNLLTAYILTGRVSDIDWPNDSGEDSSMVVYNLDYKKVHYWLKIFADTQEVWLKAPDAEGAVAPEKLAIELTAKQWLYHANRWSHDMAILGGDPEGLALGYVSPEVANNIDQITADYWLRLRARVLGTLTLPDLGDDYPKLEPEDDAAWTASIFQLGENILIGAFGIEGAMAIIQSLDMKSIASNQGLAFAWFVFNILFEFVVERRPLSYIEIELTNAVSSPDGPMDSYSLPPTAWLNFTKKGLAAKEPIGVITKRETAEQS